MYIKRLELTNFKSFGGTTTVPFLQGFTVISGPNGSGKSNLIDALLFCLGLAGSKGMRAERLPDLVNNTQTSRGRTVEASVTVTFDLSDDPELLDDSIERQIASDPPTNRPTDPPNNDNSNGASTNGIDPQSTLETDLATPDAPEPEATSPVRSPSRFQGLTEWSVTRKLRVTQQGTYTSNYFINGEPSTLTELHDQLSQLRINPEGYNVVLQGDVTRIISMNPRERREIIDELAGVAAFDRKIHQAREKLDAVKDREDRYHIVEKELIDQRDRLAQDRIKAERYQKLRQELQAKEQWESVIRYRQTQAALLKLRETARKDDEKIVELTNQLTTVRAAIQTAAAELDQLNAKVKALGEEELLSLQATLATKEAELRQLQRQEQDLQTAAEEFVLTLDRVQREILEAQQTLQSLGDRMTHETQVIEQRRQVRDQARAQLESTREATSATAASAEVWVQEQTALRHQIDALMQALEPQRTEQARLRERVAQLDRQVQEQSQALHGFAQQIEQERSRLTQSEMAESTAKQEVQALAAAIAESERELKINQETQDRLLNEQREKQRRLDKLEAQSMAMQEAQGTQATQLILKSHLPGVCGLVAQLGRVDPQYQMALEIAAGARLAHLVVEDDGVAAAAIELLKQRRAGRATFLPLNKLQRGRMPRKSELATVRGCVDFAIHLIEFEPKYEDVFTYVFGATVIFQTLGEARRYIGDYRMVTLDGELLDVSGAMTGGSQAQRPPVRFGAQAPAESAEMIALRDRLLEIDQVLAHSNASILRATALGKERSQNFAEARQKHREQELRLEQFKKELTRLEAQHAQIQRQLENNQQELTQSRSRLASLDAAIPTQEQQLEAQRQTLSQLESSQTHSEWNQLQTRLRSQETDLNEKELALRSAEQSQQDLVTQQQRLQDRIQQGQTRIEEYRAQQTQQLQQRSQITVQQGELTQQIDQINVALAELESRLGVEKETRDRAERQFREQQTHAQQIEWQQQKIQEAQTNRRQEMATIQEQLTAQEPELPNPLPEIPEEIAQDLSQLQHELRSLAKRIQAMEPVNMLALEEYERTQERLQELTDKLGTLEQERTELLLRIENFTTLRQRAFKEAFDAVNENFKSIFATLSDGDGYLHLEDPNDPFNGGLNLVAHPKGKPVQRLASMSGGEKSLTALSFIFALQRYRPSPFYAFDEVDMFLDGANVEKLSKMVKHQAELAQFVVVSLRRPMIEAAQRTIGVTQARGAYTQVLGIDLTAEPAAKA